MKNRTSVYPTENSDILQIIKTIQSCQEKVNASGNIQVVAKNLYLLEKSLLSLGRFSSTELETAGYKFATGTPAEWATTVRGSMHQILAQVPARNNYRKTHQFQPLPEDLEQVLYQSTVYQSAAEQEHGALQKAQQYEKAVALLPDLVLAQIWQDGDLSEPPYVCLAAVEMYLRCGQWDQAQRVAGYAISCNAFLFDPEEGTELVNHIALYCQAATSALAYIENHPGVLQKDMYKLLGASVDRDCLQHFLRCSDQVRREKSGNSNALYPT